MKVIKISIVIETCTRDNIPNVQIIQMVKIDIINKQKLKERNTIYVIKQEQISEIKISNDTTINF